MIVTIALCAVLCAIVLLYVLSPALRDKRGAKSALFGTFALAATALALYLYMGQPNLQGTYTELREAIALASDEAEIKAALERNPDDAEALIRMAALQVMKGTNDATTLDMLDRAEKQLPNDERIKYVRYMIKVPLVNAPASQPATPQARQPQP